MSRRYLVDYSYFRYQVSAYLARPSLLYLVIWGIACYYRPKPLTIHWFDKLCVVPIAGIILSIILWFLSEQMERSYNRYQRWLDGEN